MTTIDSTLNQAVAYGDVMRHIMPLKRLIRANGSIKANAALDRLADAMADDCQQLVERMEAERNASLRQLDLVEEINRCR